MSIQPRTERRAAASAAAAPAEAPLAARSWVVAIALGVAFLAVTAFAVRYIELVTGRYVTTGLPPVPAVAVLLLMAGWRALLRRSPLRWAVRVVPDRRQILLVFCMLCLGVFVNGQYGVRAFLPHLIALQYWQGHNNAALGRWVEYMPSWYAPADADAIRRYFEGSRGAGGVPWDLWIVPLLRWSLFFAALYLSASGLMALLRRHWIQAERLSFPLLYLPLAVTADGSGRAFSGRPIFREPLLWLGLAAAALFNGINIAHALSPSIPAPGFDYRFTAHFAPPLTPLNTVLLSFMVEAVGLGYFLPLEVSFSTWFFYALEKGGAVGGLAAGYDLPGFPFIQDQSAGAILGVAGLLCYSARSHLALAARRALGLGRRARNADEREETAALFTLLGAGVFIAGWFWVSGFSLSIALPFFVVLLAFTLVYGRLRAETGAPFEFAYPYGLPKEMLVNGLTPRGVLDLGGPRTWVLFSMFAWLSRHHFMQAGAACTIDAMKLSEEARGQRRWFYAALGVALAAGLALAFWSHLSAFYDVGANLAAAGRAEYRSTVALQEFQQMAQRSTQAVPRSDERLAAQLLGAVIAIGLGLLRTLWVKSPFHPLGFVLATAYGDHNTSICPMFLAWASKGLILTAGGLPLYRRGIPFFLGLILGHYLVAGILWPLLTTVLAPEASQSYHVYFGG